MRPTTSAPGTPGLGADHLFPSDLSYFEDPGEASGGDQMNIWRVDMDSMPDSNPWTNSGVLDPFLRYGQNSTPKSYTLDSSMASGLFSSNQSSTWKTIGLGEAEYQSDDESISS